MPGVSDGAWSATQIAAGAPHPEHRAGQLAPASGPSMILGALAMDVAASLVVESQTCCLASRADVGVLGPVLVA